MLQERGAKEGHTNEYDELHAAGIDIPGHLTLNLWRLLRTELKLGIYTQVQPGLPCFVRPLKAASWQRRFQTLPSLLSEAEVQQLPSWQQSMCSGVETKQVMWSCHLITGVHGSGGAAAAAAAGAAAPGLPLVRRRASRCTQRLCPMDHDVVWCQWPVVSLEKIQGQLPLICTGRLCRSRLYPHTGGTRCGANWASGFHGAVQAGAGGRSMTRCGGRAPAWR